MTEPIYDAADVTIPPTQLVGPAEVIAVFDDQGQQIWPAGRGPKVEGWEPSEEPCPECSSPTLTAPWWDDPPELGGACIGSLHRCTRCDWFVDR